MLNSSESKFPKLLESLSSHLISATVVCYLSGFAITNLYLGPLGIVNLDILRSRYILAGLLFLIFSGIIGFLIYGLRRILVENYEASPFIILRKSLGFSLQNIVAIYLIVPAIAIFAGTANTISPTISQSSSTIDWNQWLKTEPAKLLSATLSLFRSGLLVFFLAFSIILLINPKGKDGTKTSRREKLVIISSRISENFAKIITYTIVFFLILFASYLLGGMITLLQTNIVNMNTTMSSFFQVGWSRFFGGIVILYGLLASFMLLIFFSPRNSKYNENEGEKENSVSAYFSWAFIIGLLILIIVPLYAFGVYQYLPQQIGGGRLIPVEITSSSQSINTIFIAQTNNAYLIDRAPNTSLFLVVDQTTDKYRILEISNDLIESIVFYESP